MLGELRVVGLHRHSNKDFLSPRKGCDKKVLGCGERKEKWEMSVTGLVD